MIPPLLVLKHDLTWRDSFAEQLNHVKQSVHLSSQEIFSRSWRSPHGVDTYILWPTGGPTAHRASTRFPLRPLFQSHSPTSPSQKPGEDPSQLQPDESLQSLKSLKGPTFTPVAANRNLADRNLADRNLADCRIEIA